MWHKVLLNRGKCALSMLWNQKDMLLYISWGVYLPAAGEPWGRRPSWAGRCPPPSLRPQSEPPPPGGTPPGRPPPAGALSHLAERSRRRHWETRCYICSGASYVHPVYVMIFRPFMHFHWKQVEGNTPVVNINRWFKWSGLTDYYHLSLRHAPTILHLTGQMCTFLLLCFNLTIYF